MAQKPCPYLILSVEFPDHERAVVSYVPRTTTLRQTRFEVPHVMRGLDAGAFDAQGIGSIPMVKCERRVGIAAPDIVQQVETAVKRWLALR